MIKYELKQIIEPLLVLLPTRKSKLIFFLTDQIFISEVLLISFLIIVDVNGRKRSWPSETQCHH